MLILAIAFIIIIVVLIIFSFPQFSPIPYFPSNNKDIKLIIKALSLKNDQVILDLGAGSGTVIFAASREALKKKLNTQFIAIEINPVLLLILFTRRLFKPNKKNVTIMYGDMFKMKLKLQKIKVKTVYLYISPWFVKKVVNNLKKSMEHFNLVSYMYELPNTKPKNIIKGKNKIFIYDF